MSHRTHVRAEQALVLRDSLAGSSLSILTLVVAVMIATRLLGDAPVGDKFDWREVPIPRHPVEVFDPTGGPAPPAPIPPSTIVQPAIVLPVDDREKPAIIDDFVPPTQRDIGRDPGFQTDGIVKGGPGGGGGGGIDPDAIPSKDVLIVVEEFPGVVTRVMPVYPELAKQAGMEGKVFVAAYVGVDGRVRKVEMEGKPSIFDAAALDAVRQWVFSPAKTDGHPVAVWVRVPVVFQLH